MAISSSCAERFRFGARGANDLVAAVGALIVRLCLPALPI